MCIYDEFCKVVASFSQNDVVPLEFDSPQSLAVGHQIELSMLLLQVTRLWVSGFTISSVLSWFLTMKWPLPLQPEKPSNTWAKEVIRSLVHLHELVWCRQVPPISDTNTLPIPGLFFNYPAQLFSQFKNWVSTAACSYLGSRLGISTVNKSRFSVSQIRCYRRAMLSYTFRTAAKKIRSCLLNSKTFPLAAPDPLPYFLSFQSAEPAVHHWLDCLSWILSKTFLASNHSFLHKPFLKVSVQGSKTNTVPKCPKFLPGRYLFYRLHCRQHSHDHSRMKPQMTVRSLLACWMQLIPWSLAPIKRV